MIEILNPRWGDVRPVFEREFQGMVVEPVTAEELRFVGEKLVSRLHEEMTQDEKQFIVSVKEGKPPWDLLGVPGIENLPAVRCLRSTPQAPKTTLLPLLSFCPVHPNPPIYLVSGMSPRLTSFAVLRSEKYLPLKPLASILTL